MSNSPIKFRVWDVLSSKYLESTVMWSVVKMPEEMMPGHPPWIPFLTMAISSPENKYVVEEFVGLLDKNGKEIYEGDIVEYDVSEYQEGRTKQIAYFKYNEAFAAFGLAYRLNGDCIDHLTDYSVRRETFKIIGNIYENPELLLKPN